MWPFTFLRRRHLALVPYVVRYRYLITGGVVHTTIVNAVDADAAVRLVRERKTAAIAVEEVYPQYKRGR